MVLDDQASKKYQEVAGKNSSSDRYYTQAPGTAYVLPADEKERARLSLQHRILHKLWNGRLIKAPLELTAGDHILECGVGGGDWILELSKEIPENVTIEGIDIESRLFPKDIPKDITLSVNSVTNLPENWTNRFTYVHQSLMIGGLRKPEWPVALGEMYRVLKPGGFVELREVAGPREGPEGYTDLTAYYLLDKLFDIKGLDVAVHNRLPDLLAEAGFVDVVWKKKKAPLGKWGGEDAATVATTYLGFYRGFKKKVLEQGGLGKVKDGEEFDRVMDELGEWLNERSGIYYNYYVFIGRKPSV